MDFTTCKLTLWKISSTKNYLLKKEGVALFLYRNVTLFPIQNTQPKIVTSFCRIMKVDILPQENLNCKKLSRWIFVLPKMFFCKLSSMESCFETFLHNANIFKESCLQRQKLLKMLFSAILLILCHFNN